jgi:hypothetical protein
MNGYLDNICFSNVARYSGASFIPANISDGTEPAAPVGVSARYWRVMGVGDAWDIGLGSALMEVAEIQMFESIDCTGTNICIGATASGSSTWQGDPSAVNDGSTNTYWASARGSSTPEWWGITCAAPKTVNSLVFYPRAGGLGQYAPRTAKLQYSIDNSTWTDVGSVFNFAQNTGTYVTSVHDVQASSAILFTQSDTAWTINGNSATSTAPGGTVVLHGPVVAVGTYIDVTLDTGYSSNVGFLGLSSSRGDWAYTSSTNNYVTWYYGGNVFVNGANIGSAPSQLTAGRYRIALKAGGVVVISRVSADGLTLQGVPMSTTLSELPDTHLVLFGQSGYTLCGITYNSAGAGSGGL